MPSFRSWGNYPGPAQRSSSATDIVQLTRRLEQTERNTLGVGMGRSYGDSCLAASGDVLDMHHMDRFVAADWTTGVIRAEAGVTLKQVIDLALPRGWFLPVTPGTKFVTLGGAVGNDVHGKNHHVHGTFGRHVGRLALLRSHEGIVECSPTDRPELFAATIGGLGLTGIILWVEFTLMQVGCSELDEELLPCASLSEFFNTTLEQDPKFDYGVGWVDCTLTGKHLGAGYYSSANHRQSGTLQVANRTPLSVPVAPPFSLVNRLSLTCFNRAYRFLHGRPKSRVVNYEAFFYPLDRIHHWNRIYGNRGFQQFQCVIPLEAAAEGMNALLTKISSSFTGSFLTVLKRCGDLPSPGLLSFPMPGYSFAIDFSQSKRLQPLFNELDAIVADFGGRLYPAKDAHMEGSHFRAAYPEWERVERLRDPKLMSHFWQRVTNL